MAHLSLAVQQASFMATIFMWGLNNFSKQILFKVI
jgi:hypothetical protein